MSRGYINKQLYEARLAMGLTRAQAGKLLDMWSLHLKLIEKGYVSVPKRKRQKFIQVYNLRSNFFKVNSNYVANIDKQIDEAKENAKFKKRVASKAFRWTALGLTVANAAWAGYGVYCLNKHEWMPTATWTGNFKTFWTQMKEIAPAKGTVSPSILYPGDWKYSIYDNKTITYDDGYTAEKLSTFGKEVNACESSLESSYYVTKDSEVYPIVTNKSKFDFSVFVYNKKKIIFSSFYGTSTDPTFSISNAMGVLDEYGLLTFRPFQYYQGGVAHEAKEGSGIYNEFTLIFNKYVARAFENFNSIFKSYNLGYTNAYDFIADLKNMSRDQILHFRMGLWFTILGTIFGIGFAFMLGLSFFFYYQHKKKGTYLTRYKVAQPPKGVLFANYPKYKKDMNIKLFIPEFVLIIIGLLILALSQAAIYLSITYFFKSTGMSDPTPLRNFSSNLLIAGVLLLFLIKLDTYTRKSLTQLIVNIFFLTFAGLAFYIAECVLYSSFATGNNIFSMIFSFLSSVLPGNFIWPLALYALMFLFLFATPDKYKNNIHKINKWRALSAIPTILLLFSLVWQFSLKKIANAPYYVNFLFFSKGTTLTLFFLIYVYMLFIFQRYCRKRIGFVQAETLLFNSKRYFFTKNSIAAITLGLLLIVELCFKFLMPNNQYNLGNNWAVGIIIPFVLFYHPHLGNRNGIWDMIVMILKVLLAFMGYGAAITEVLTYMNFGDVLFILN